MQNLELKTYLKRILRYFEEITLGIKENYNWKNKVLFR